mmetsp:Transcript_22784/g.49738  ORF Transcript_22784/g.49738 Transcript_22784/m.49738 type:complete len:223 (-) Transcript_22784:169-837(-)
MPALRNGIACLGPSLFASVAFCLGLVASSLCNFVELDSTNALQVNPIYNVRSIGFWCYESESGSRYEYNDLYENRWDDKFEVARSLGLTANCIGFVVWLIYLCAGCIKMPSPVFASIGCLCMCACMFEGFKLWIFRSTFFCDRGNGFGGCSLDTGARCTISAVVFWFVAMCMSSAHAVERTKSGEEDEEPAAEPEPEPEQPADAEKDAEAGEGEGEPKTEDT